MADIEVSGGKGTVIGDYATVFQSFSQAPAPLTGHIRTAQFSALVDERTRTMIGRENVFERIGALIGGAEFGSGYVVIRGEPGIGKTSIAACLVKRHGYVHHFNIAPENIRTARQFLENVCAQLIIRYGLGHTALPPNVGDDSGLLSQLLLEARAKAGGPVVVVVDALDEADNTGVPLSANRLFLPRALPEGVFFVLTSRDEADFRLDVDHDEEIWIRDDDPDNL